MKRIHLSVCRYLSKDVTYLPGMAADHPYKPNGLWYAIDDQWRVWCEEQRDRIFHWQTWDNGKEKFTGYRYSYELNVDLSKVCILDDVGSVMAFHRKYGYKYQGNVTVIDWEKVKVDYTE